MGPEVLHASRQGTRILSLSAGVSTTPLVHSSTDNCSSEVYPTPSADQAGELVGNGGTPTGGRSGALAQEKVALFPQPALHCVPP